VSNDALEHLRRHVHADPDLALQLRRVAAERFSAEVIALAPEVGDAIDDADIERELERARRAWILRWIRSGEIMMGSCAAAAR
jgi:hypothetical protein